MAILFWGAARGTSLSPGDVAVIGFNCDNPDEFGFVTLVDLEEGTEIYFTDSGVTAEGTFRGGEGAVKYTAPTPGVAAGTVIIYSAGHTGFVSANDARVGTGGLALSSSGDQIIVFQGSSAAPEFIYALNMEGTGWQPGATSSNESALPPGLADGSSALALNEADNGYYGGSVLAGTPAELLQAISQKENWTTGNGRMESSSWVASFTVSTVSSTGTTVQFTSPGAAIPEGTSPYELAVSITNGSPSSETTANVVWVAEGTAANGTDISVFTSQTVTFAAGDSTHKTVEITVVDDSEFEGTETAVFELQNVAGGSGASAGSPSRFTLSIQDNDAPGIVINEILADPPQGNEGDANGDGSRDSGDDEFIELVNNHGLPVSITGWTLSDGTGLRHTFPQGTDLERGEAILIFGGGRPAGTFGNSLVQTASEGTLSLNNGGDTVILTAANGTRVASHSFGAEGGDDQSLTRDPDVTGTFKKHTRAGESGGRLFSPGTKVNGRPFRGVSVQESSGSTTVTEGGISDTYGIVLESKPTANVAIGITAGSEVNVSPSTLTFTADDYGVIQWVTVTAVDDPFFEGIHGDRIYHEVTSGDSHYHAIPVDTVTVTVTDDDPPPVVINEIHYNPAGEQGTDDDYEFIELFNRSGYTVFLSGYHFRAGIEFVFDSLDSLTPGSYLVLAKRGTTYPGSIPWTAGTLANDGETLIMVTDGGTVVDSVPYGGADPWPPEANGSGPSLELVDPFLENAVALSWQASFIPGGTPGAVNSENSAPQAVTDSFELNEDHVLVQPPPGVLENDTDANGDALTAVLTAAARYGDLLLSTDGSFEYVPEVDFYGNDTFLYGAFDGTDTSSSAAVFLDVWAVNDPPGLARITDPDSIMEDSGEHRIDLAGIHSGASNEHQVLTVTARSANERLIGPPRVRYASPDSTGTLFYTPLPDMYGRATIWVTVTDDGGRTNGGMDSTTVSFDVVILPLNDPPDLPFDFVIMSEDGSDTLMLPAVDVDGDTLLYAEVGTDTSAIDAGLVVEQGIFRLTLTPAPDWHGTARVFVTITDGRVEVEEGFDLTVTPVNDPPDPFVLVWPEDSMTVAITTDLLKHSFIMAWEASRDRDGDSLTYDVTADGDLSFLSVQGIGESRFSLPYEVVVEMMGDTDRVDGTWTVVASDGDTNRSAANGPFFLSLDKSRLALLSMESVPSAFTLHPNYPNPFNPVTRIRYDVPEISNVEIVLYDLLGRKIRTLASGIHRPGYHGTLWRGCRTDGSPLASGVYILAMAAWDPSSGEIRFRRTRKIILMR
ncbi:MAG: lamin tail domain-containing protein [Fidelibacterota bacterium]